VNHQVDSGATAVYLACQEGHLDIVKHLVDEAGASMKLRCYDGMSCLHAATLSGQQSLLHWLVRPLPPLYMLLLHTPYYSLSVLMYARAPAGFFPGMSKFIGVARSFSRGALFSYKKLTTFFTTK